MEDTSTGWQNQHQGLISRLQWMLKENLHADVHFLVGCNEIVYFSAHRLILAAGSPVFESMFFGRTFQENLESEVSVEVEDVDPIGFRIMLKYLYEENILFRNYYEAFQTLFAAKRFEICGLIEKSTKYISSIQLSSENVFEVLEFSRFLELYDLIANCVLFIEENAMDSFKSKTFYSVGLETVVFVLKRSLLRISETELLNFAISWLRNLDQTENIDTFQSVAYSLLENIHFPSVGSEELCNFIKENEDILSSADKIAIMKHLMEPQTSPLPSWCCSDKCRTNLTENVSIGLIDDGDKQYTSIISWFKCSFELTVKDPVYRDIQSMTLVWCNRSEDLPLQMDVAILWNNLVFETKHVRKTKRAQEILFDFNQKIMLPGKNQKFTITVDFKQPAPVCFFKPKRVKMSSVDCSLQSAFAMSPLKRKIVFNKAFCVKDICMICFPPEKFLAY